jgi:hypothetical protein
MRGGYFIHPYGTYATFAEFPTTGTENVIFVDQAGLELYIWDGVSYVLISAGGGGGPATTDGLTEGTTNLYYTDARVDARIEETLMQQYTLLLDEISATVSYVGEALPGSLQGDAVWRIKKLDEGGTPELQVEWADGTSDFDKVWDDRATYTYS